MEMTFAILARSADEPLTAKTGRLSVPADLTVRDVQATCTEPKTVNMQVEAVWPGREYRLILTPAADAKAAARVKITVCAGYAAGHTATSSIPVRGRCTQHSKVSF